MTSRIFFDVLSILLTSIISPGSPMELSQENRNHYCEFDSFNASCSSRDEVVIMTSAFYGRMVSGTCVLTDFGHVGCYRDALFIMEKRCSGRRRCVVPIPDREMSTLKPCNQDLKLYLEAGYKCMKVLQAKKCETILTKSIHPHHHHYNHHNNNNPPFDNNNNNNDDPSTTIENNNNNNNNNHNNNNKLSHLPNVILATDKPGYIPSIVTAETGCGSLEHPWIVRALPGQKVKLRLIDFNMDANEKGMEDGGDGGGDEDDKKMVYVTNCSVCAIVKDSLLQTGTSLCRNYSRNSHVYTSLSHVIELRIIIGRENDVTPQFIFVYEAQGCADYPPPSNGWVHRVDGGNVTYVGCRDTPHKHLWTIQCSAGLKWDGEVGSCNEDSFTSMRIGPINFARNITMVMIPIVAGLVGLCILIVGLIFVRRYFKRSTNEPIYCSADQPPPPPNTDHQLQQHKQYVIKSTTRDNSDYDSASGYYHDVTDVTMTTTTVDDRFFPPPVDLLDKNKPMTSDYRLNPYKAGQLKPMYDPTHMMDQPVRVQPHWQPIPGQPIKNTVMSV